METPLVLNGLTIHDIGKRGITHVAIPGIQLALTADRENVLVKMSKAIGRTVIGDHQREAHPDAGGPCHSLPRRVRNPDEPGLV